MSFRLRHLKSKRLPSNISTDGIEISDWKTKHFDGTLRLYDFGGQDVFYPTHSFFLSKRVVVLLVVDLCDMNVQNCHHWLQQLQHVGQPIRVFIVGTHADKLKDEEEATKRLNELHRTILYRFDALISDYFVVSMNSKTSVKILREAIVEGEIFLLLFFN